MLSNIKSASLIGMHAHTVEVEIDLSSGVPAFTIVGLPDTAIQESRERVRAAILNSEYEFPLKRITVNLAPADIRKEGPSFDLPISCAILKASGVIYADKLDDYCLIGELALNGHLRKTNGILSVAITARKRGYKGIILPAENAAEAALIDGVEVIGVRHLRDVVEFSNGNSGIDYDDGSSVHNEGLGLNEYEEDFKDVKGQAHVKRALEIAAAGGHNVLMLGPPGSGKTMLAKRFAGILPDMSVEEAIEVTRVYSVAGKINGGGPLIQRRPFRSPHHTISPVGLAGGGAQVPKPGEVSLSHNGILFLDELLEFTKSSLEVLRQPMETGEVTISRSLISVKYPARFLLLSSTNPCPCGYLGDRKKECVCAPNRISQYQSKLSGPLIDRIDIHIEVPRLTKDELVGKSYGESSAVIRKRVQKARDIQNKRFNNDSKRSKKIYCNSQMGSRDIRQCCVTTDEAQNFLEKAVDMLGFSARAYDRVLKVARTIADLDANSEKIDTAHIAEAIQYRSLDRLNRN